MKIHKAGVAGGVYDITEMDESFLITIWDALKTQRDKFIKDIEQAIDRERRGLTYADVRAEITGEDRAGVEVSNRPYTASEDLSFLCAHLQMVSDMMFQIEQLGLVG